MSISRRQLLAAAVAASTGRRAQAQADNPWDEGLVRHLLPTINHERLLLKASFRQPLSSPPTLRAGSHSTVGVRADSAGEFWWFDLAGLDAETSYELELLGDRGRPLCDPWPIATFPSPQSSPRRFRLFVYTCAGGHPATLNPDTGDPYWVSIENRQKLLKTGLSYQPDAMIAIGDHVYWDLLSPVGRVNLGGSDPLRALVGEFNRSAPVLGTTNEDKLKIAATPQISDLYGTMFRSTPTFFVQDDHDYFENDEATQEMVTFPPDDFAMRMARSAQRLYYPEFLPNAERPLGLPSSSAADRAADVSESYGTLRYGDLAEIMMYDCRRHLSLKGPAAGFLPNVVEGWLTGRMKSQDTHHVVNLPSTPVGWSAGKWGEWYPDLLQPNGKLGLQTPKYWWQEGWRLQHNRLLRAASEMDRLPLFLSGDLHAIGEGQIHRYGNLDLRRNPVATVLTGPISTGPKAWPSSWRGTPPQTVTGLEITEGLAPIEKNGFTILDFTEDRVDGLFFQWKMDQPEERLDDLKPFHEFTFSRRG